MASPLRLAAACALLAALLAAPSPAMAADSTRYDVWSSTSELAKGTSEGVKVASNKVVLAKPIGTLRWKDPYGNGTTKTYDYGRWTSPWASTGFDTRTLVPSWTAIASSGAWIRVEVQVRNSARTSTWDQVADWTYAASTVHRRSWPAQSDDLVSLAADTVTANGGNRFSQYRLRVYLYRPQGTTITPTLYAVQGIAATYVTRSQAVSRTTMTSAKELAVPRYSQMTHRGHYPEYGGGGEAWCSPTSTAMVLRYWGKGPKPADYSWEKGTDPWVDHAARYTYDYRYEGTGNWAFNTAYASIYSLWGYVSRFTDLRDAEGFIKAGVPVIVPLAWTKGGLTGAPISSTPGHLMVITGFEKDGDVIVNDPAAASNSSVRRVYNRAQFEKAWLGGSGGTAYLIHPGSTKLPTDTGRW